MTMQDPYLDFLRAKIKLAPALGFDVRDEDISPLLKGHQRAIVKWACRGGRRAIFARFGLGKSIMQLEVLRLVTARFGGRGLIIAPYGVHLDILLDAAKLGITIRIIQRIGDCDAEGLYLTNYEPVRDGKLDPNDFIAASLDEASVLRSFGSKTYQIFLSLFAKVRFRFVATATPSPNRYKELIHYAGFLGVMDTGQALTRFFQRDSTKANNLTLYPHKEDEFWLWVGSWAVFLERPSDLGYSDEGYDLPPFELRPHEVSTRVDGYRFERDGQGQLLDEASGDLGQTARARRASLPARIAKTAEIVAADPNDHFLLWHDLEDERRAIERAIPGVISVHGAQTQDERKTIMGDFADGRLGRLATKPIIAGSGPNFQRHCHRAIFCGVSHKFNDLIQAVHRIQRFQQPCPVIIDVIFADTERQVWRDLKAKWKRDDELRAKMTEIIKRYGLSDLAMTQTLERTIGVTRVEASGENWRVAHNDTVMEARLLEDNSIDLIATSIPFANHYEYTPSYNDFGHTDDNGHFWAQMDFLTPELLRALKPGRMAAIHVKDRVLFGSVTGQGVPTVSPFHAETIFHYRRHGFQYMGMIHINTDVVRENNQTYRLGYSEMLKDATKMGVGCPEYVILVRKPQSDRSKGYADAPVRHDEAEYSLARWQVDAHSFWRSSGERLATPEELAAIGPGKLKKLFKQWSLAGVYDYEAHVRIGEALQERGALPSTWMALEPASHDPDIWDDVNRMLTLNGAQSAAGREQHVCLARGSLVLTANGFVPIEEVEIGDFVLTHKGRWRPVLAVANTGVRAVVDVQAQGVAALTLTPEHELWTRKVGANAWAKSHSRLAADRVEPEWLRADRAVDSYINLKLPPIADKSLTEQELRLIGRWLADGHVGTRGDFFVSIGPAKLAEFEAMAPDFIGSRAERTAIQIRLKNLRGQVIDVLRRCGRGAGGKSIPGDLLSLPQSKAMALLNGYLSGDGHFHAERNRWTASSISRGLLLGVAMLAQRAHGAIASIYAGRAAGTAIIEGREVETRQDWVLCFDIPDLARYKGGPFIRDDGAWKKVRRAEPAGETETWCLRVAEDESFTAEGCIVKNCPLQFDIVDRLIRRYSEPGELVYDPFGGLFTVPLRALHLGRRGRGVELSGSYFLDGVKYLQAAERQIGAPSLFDLMRQDTDGAAAEPIALASEAAA